ncbi:ABC transporter ATP-binding protein [Agrobacterium sp. NPDC090283]|uniref:ABC transporter ATP-binding protein n=1 Tax=Agrobacterium sp. NPDC090283 TaxID=3363920 RepID=UPI00383A15BC
MASVNIESIVKRYGAYEALRDISFSIADGEFVVLVGPSGCGKSTLLRMIAGLEDISDGTIAIGSRIVNELEPKERDIAMVFQSYALYPHMTVRDNMAFSLKLKGASAAEITDKVQRAAQILGLEQLVSRYPKQLSGGQRQRVAMGRAIVRDPQVFLFDEPLSNLDAKLRVQMRSEIKELHQRLGTTTVYVTHDQVEAMTMADRIVVMRDGHIEQIGSPLEIYDHPANMFVAGFIGSPAMNFLSGTAVEDGFMLAGGNMLPLPLQSSRLAVHYGVRPEHLRIDPNGIPAEVVVTEPTGSETMVVAKIGSQQVHCVFHERLDLGPGSTIHLQPETGKVHLFGASGERLAPK